MLWEAWKRVRANRGAAGVDRITLAYVENEYGAERSLAELQAALRAGTYRPAPARRVDIPKPPGGTRPLGIPVVCDRVAQQAARLVLEPIFEADFLPCWPSQQAMKRLRGKIRDRTGRNRVGVKDIRDVIADLNPLLRGWGNYFRTGNAAGKFRQADDYVVFRLRRLMIKKRGRNLRAGQAQAWTEQWFNGHGLHRLRGTVRYPRAA